MGNVDTATMLMALLAGASVLVGYFLIHRLLQQKKTAAELSSRLKGLDSPYSEIQDDELGSADREAKESGLADTFAALLTIIFPLLGKDFQNEKQQIAKQLSQAGIYNPNAPVYYLFWQYVVSVILVVLALPLFMSDQEGSALYADLFTGLVLAVLGVFGAKLYLKNAITKRRKVLIRSFPDALDLLLVCVESGLALDAALARVCKELGEAHPVITEELNRTRTELSVLSDRNKALYNLGERTDIVAFRALSAALIQSEKFGTSLADTLRVMADDFRQTRLLEAENKANRLPALMTVPLITMLLPALFIILIGPAILGVMESGVMSD